MSPAIKLHLSAFSESRFISNLRSTSKSGVLKEVTALLSEDVEIRHHDLLREALEAREKLGSTGIGKEVAIPHGRTLSVPKLKAVIARSKKGVPWGSPDGKAVKIFFVVVAPPTEKTNEYLPLLGALVGGMREKQHRDKILAAKTYEEVLQALEAALRG